MRTLVYAAAAVACLSGLAACARGGGIGLGAVIADQRCEAEGYHLGTPEYTNCRIGIARQQAAANDAIAASYGRQTEMLLQQMNRQQTCVYNGSTIGGITSGTATCM